MYRYPSITLADVYAALAYYWDHRDEIERTLAEEHAFVEAFQSGSVTPLLEKLNRLRR